MVDSSVGGKTGVNHPKGKNLIGAFNQPKAVFIDPETLKSLPKREFSAGMAEVIKYGVIRDKELFEYLEIEKNKNELINLKNEYLIKIISSSIKTKSHVVSQDEHENGVRAILNYGHSFGNTNLILPSRTFLSPISIVRTSSLFILGISVGRS